MSDAAAAPSLLQVKWPPTRSEPERCEKVTELELGGVRRTRGGESAAPAAGQTGKREKGGTCLPAVENKKPTDVQKAVKDA